MNRSFNSNQKLQRRTWLLAIALLLGCAAAQAAEFIEVSAQDELLEHATLDEERGMWWSAPLTGSAWIPLGPRGTVLVEHGLGRIPVSVEVYLSFVGDDSAGESPRSFFLVAGDVANIMRITDEEIEVRNNTQGDFYFRVLLR